MNENTAVQLRVSVKKFARYIAHPLNKSPHMGLPGISCDTLAAIDLIEAEADAMKEGSRIDRIYTPKSALVSFLHRHLPFILHQLRNKGDILRALRAIRVAALAPSVGAPVVLTDALAAACVLIVNQ